MQYVVQKYIQNPLIIHKKKFDIRQWVLVEDYQPAKIWIYGQFYCRFCIQEYDQDKISNKFAHLTNNSIQKYNKNLSQKQLKQCLKNSMWSQDELKEYIDDLYKPGQFKHILNKMKQIIIATILSTSDQVYGRKNSFQLIGYDFMIDDKLNPWLIEINTSPAMDYSTPVTARLVKMVLEDTAKVVIDMSKKKSKKRTAGLFKCVYTGENKFVSKYYNVLDKYVMIEKQDNNKTNKKEQKVHEKQEQNELYDQK